MDGMTPEECDHPGRQGVPLGHLHQKEEGHVVAARGIKDQTNLIARAARVSDWVVVDKEIGPTIEYGIDCRERGKRRNHKEAASAEVDCSYDRGRCAEEHRLMAGVGAN